jgi:hypothetical protein
MPIGGVMFKKFLLLILVLSAVLTACSIVEEDSIPWDRIEILPETNPEYLGSYRFERCWGNPLDRVCEPEYGEWTSDLELLVDQNREICFGGFEEGKVYAQPDYEWVEIRYQGRNCIQLQKKGK